MSERCPICGETAPEPASLCIPRLIQAAKPGEPCDYSLEGEARFAAEIGEEKAALLMAVLATPSTAGRT
jgi:hypothetical protein